jgi:hypothetical protein
MRKTEAGQNFVKFALGKTMVIGLRDGYVDMPATRLRKPDGQPFPGDLPPSIPLVDGKFRLSDPSLVDTVATTHTHEDHVNGLVAADGSNAFPGLKRLFIPSQAIPLFDKIDRLARFRDVRQFMCLQRSSIDPS